MNKEKASEIIFIIKNNLHIRGKIERMSQVNLDALIKREDLFKEGLDETDKIDKPEYKELRIDSDLNPKSWFFKTLRKPDFQRETSEWRPERIVGLMKSFINGDIIPSIILWNWKGNNFIIDGGHRLSALVAWIVNDYGDGAYSKTFFGEENISKEQKRNADKTRALIREQIGEFQEYEHALNNQDTVPAEQLLKAKILTNRSIQVQWIKAKTSQDAEKSFFRINGEATPINETEAVMLKSREKPNAIAARAIIHSGSAHKYWRNFTGKQEEIERVATAINKLLFDPELDPKTVNFPIAGKEYSTQTLEVVFGVVNMINDLDQINLRRKEIFKKDAIDIAPARDETGDETLRYLNRVERIISIISGNNGYSLGLSPLVYFYSYKGRFQITSFLAIVHLINQWDKERKADANNLRFQKFCSIRDKFEQFILDYKIFITQATTNVGSGLKSYRRLADLFSFIIDHLLVGKASDEILELIKNKSTFGFIKIFEAENRYNEERNPPGKRIPKETGIEVVIKTFLTSKIVCPICHGHATFHSYNIDHIREIKNNGLAEVDNLQLTHFYCNAEKERIKIEKSRIGGQTTLPLIN